MEGALVPEDHLSPPKSCADEAGDGPASPETPKTVDGMESTGKALPQPLTSSVLTDRGPAQQDDKDSNGHGSVFCTNTTAKSADDLSVFDSPRGPVDPRIRVSSTHEYPTGASALHRRPSSRSHKGCNHTITEYCPRAYLERLLDGDFSAMTQFSCWRPASWMTNFSIINEFLFVPPPPSYQRDDPSVFSVGRHTVAQRFTIGWVHVHQADGLPLGLSHWRRVLSPLLLGCLSDSITFAVLTRTWEADPPNVPPGTRQPGSTNGLRSPANQPRREGAINYDDTGSTRLSSRGRLAFFFHGNAADAGKDCLRVAARFLKGLPRGSQMVVIEYPGFGMMNSGKATELSTKITIERVLQYIFATTPLARLHPSQIVLIGHSIGAAVATHALAVLTDAFHSTALSTSVPHAAGMFCTPARACGGCILIAPFSSVKSVVNPDEERAPFGSCSQAATFCESLVPPEMKRRYCHTLAQLSYGHFHNGIEAATLAKDSLTVNISTGPPRPGATDVTAAGGRRQSADPSPRALPRGRKLHWLYQIGHALMVDRFPSAHYLAKLEEAHSLFQHVPLVLFHGAMDTTISPLHSIHIVTAIASALESRERQRTRSGEEDVPHTSIAQLNNRSRDSASIRVWLRIDRDDHNSVCDLSDQRIEEIFRLCDAVETSQPRIAPIAPASPNAMISGLAIETSHQGANSAALLSNAQRSLSTTDDEVENSTMRCDDSHCGDSIIIASFPAGTLLHTDDGRQQLPSSWEWRSSCLRCLTSSLFGALAIWVLVCSMTTTEWSLEGYVGIPINITRGGVNQTTTGSDNSFQRVGGLNIVRVWGVVEAAALTSIAILSAMRPVFTLTRMHPQASNHDGPILFVIMAVIRIVTYLTVASVGVLLGPICALSESVCGQLHLDEDANTLPLLKHNDAWPLKIQRGSMLALGAFHCVHALIVILQHH